MIVLQDYNAYYSPATASTKYYPGILVPKGEGLQFELDSCFIQGSETFKVVGTPQKNVVHTKYIGEFTPFVYSSANENILKGTDGSDLLIDGEVHEGNTSELVEVGDYFTFTICKMRNLGRPRMSLFYAYLGRCYYLRGVKRVRFVLAVIICYERKNGSVQYAWSETSNTSIYNRLTKYDEAYMISLWPVVEYQNVLDYYLYDKASNNMPVSPLARRTTDLQSYFQQKAAYLNKQMSSFTSQIGQGVDYIDPLYTFRMGQCADAAIQGNLFTVESNMLEMWKESLSGTFGSEIREWARAISNLSKNRKGHTKRVAKAYLATTYGTKLTLNDMEQWKAAIEKYMWSNYYTVPYSTARGRNSYNVGAPFYTFSDGTAAYNYCLYYDPLERLGGSQDFRSVLRAFRLTPNAKRTWEILPFSFVVDWFLPISDIFTTIESEDTLYENMYRTLGEVSSVKMVFPLREFPSVKLVSYVRLSSPRPFTVPQPDFNELNPLKRGVSGSAYLNGSALILSKGKSKRLK